MSIYDYEVRKLNGEQGDLGAYRGQVALIVNTASACGFTPQYAELQALHEKYASQGFAVLGFPCNQFGEQEPGSAEEIREFCSLNYGVTFPMFEKTEVKGDGAHPLFKYLTDRTGGEIRWNFTKFLVGRDGETVRLYDHAAKPLEMADDIEKLLG